MFPIETFQSTLKKLADILHQQEIPFHLTGGVSSIAYSEPRMTQDIDIVVSNERDQGSHKSRRDLRHLFKNATEAEQEAIKQLSKKYAKQNLLNEVLMEQDEIDL